MMFTRLCTGGTGVGVMDVAPMGMAIVPIFEPLELECVCVCVCVCVSWSPVKRVVCCEVRDPNCSRLPPMMSVPYLGTQ